MCPRPARSIVFRGAGDGRLHACGRLRSGRCSVSPRCPRVPESKGGMSIRELRGSQRRHELYPQSGCRPTGWATASPYQFRTLPIGGARCPATKCGFRRSKRRGRSTKRSLEAPGFRVEPLGPPSREGHSNFVLPCNAFRMRGLGQYKNLDNQILHHGRTKSGDTLCVRLHIRRLGHQLAPW